MLRFPLILAVAAVLVVSCGGAPSESGDPAGETATAAPVKGVAALQAQAAAVFKPLPAAMASEDNPITEAKTNLGRTLYYDTRLSQGNDLSCNSCHALDRYGVDNEPTSRGHKQQRGGRNSPTVYNAALHIAQFWDGRAADVEEQAKEQVLDPIEMAMPDAAAVEAVLRSIPAYVETFRTAFPGEGNPVTYDNMARAIGAFERGLVTPAAFDGFLAGDQSALNAAQLAGLKTFLDTGCATCHNGAGIGGGMYQKLGLVKPYETADTGRAEVTKNEADTFFFKVPSLRNIEMTGPYFHDGQVAGLNDAIQLMAEHQLGKTLSDREITDIREFLATLTGPIPALYIAPPNLP